MPAPKKALPSTIGSFFEYETQKIVQISSIKIGIIFRAIQFCIFAYVIGYVLIYGKGYQETDDVVGSVTTKIKGLAYLNLTGHADRSFEGIYDSIDLVNPPLENNAFFVTTNLIYTQRQKRSICAEAQDMRHAKCTNDSQCVKGRTPLLGNGMYTGKCLPPSKLGDKHSTCEILSWCPVELDEFVFQDKPTFPAVVNYTVLVKNDIEFAKFGVKRRNILGWASRKFLYKCRYDSKDIDYRFCPIIRLGTILESIGYTDKLLLKGGVVSITIDWQCNLDWPESYCVPTYTFRRVDDKQAKIAKGLNYRHAQYYHVNGTIHRDVIKAYGIRFIIFVTGTARKFSIVPLTVNLGSGLALLGISSVLCDMIILNVVGNKEMYNEAKYQNVSKKKDTEEDEEEEPEEEESPSIIGKTEDNEV